MSAMWTKELPQESGFYWYRDEVDVDTYLVAIVKWDAEDRILTYCGNELRYEPGDGVFTVDGLFWNERLQAPPLP